MIVNVKVIDIQWLYKDNKTFVDLVSAITHCERNAVFESSFVLNLLNQFWPENRNKITYKFLIPYYLYMFTNITFLYNVS